MEKQKNLPQLRFPDYEGEWGKKKLGDTAELTSSKRVYMSDYTSSGIPFFRGKEITELKQGLEPSDILYISESAYLKFKEQYGVPEYDDILMTAVGTLGNVYRITDDKPFYFKDGNLIWFRKIQEHSSFLEILLFVNRKEVEKSSIGSTQRALTMVELRKLCFFFPALPEQQKIASFFTAIDQKISQLKRKKSLLEQYKKGVMQKIFSQQIRFKDDNGQEFPKWEKMRLEEISNKKASTISANTIEENSGVYPIYGATGFLKNVDFFLEENDYIGIVKDGAGVGRLLYCEGNSSVLGTLDIIRPKKGINTYFLYLLLGQIDFTKFITGSTIPHIYYKDYSKNSLLIPCPKEQTKIANFLSVIDDKIHHTQKQIEKDEVWKKGLMQQMFV